MRRVRGMMYLITIIRRINIRSSGFAIATKEIHKILALFKTARVKGVMCLETILTRIDIRSLCFAITKQECSKEARL